ncbi:zinc ribbon domain-containing protein [Aeoliella sp. ICT_H6.2]|uniref:Zinc ribbon domain-containing protein n=1 Tax=Aeoliella straminimaris TaxID=2954799 RepID=A0A9X2FDZ8_9BACT|nr:zinc ribbon domain-containing protein [Aeoliella straminimaris]MCO6044121.1 zinc ribbon domain-containing protein [Aeoliella straminimaris]
MPKPADDILDAEVAPDWGFDDEDFDVEPPAATSSAGGGEDRKPCPMCGEMIARDAIKCRYCGEVFDPALKKKMKKRGKSYDADDEDLSTGDWVIAILCSGIGCIVGIVYMIQGKPKGGKMIGISVLAGILWNVVSAALQMMANP